MSDKNIHIIALDVPYPPDYGGAVDMFYRIKALHEIGYKIHLHCYEYGRGKQKQLEEITEKVHYYRRKKTLFDWLNTLPFIVQTRKSKKLLKRLLTNEYPILFEGLHTTYFLKDERLSNRVKLVRTHNIEHDYYMHLATDATGWKKKFYLSEAKKLKSYESILSQANHILAIKESEKDYFSKYTNSVLLSPCISIEKPIYQETKPYALFHGNLSVPENERAVKWLVNSIESNIDFIVAGKNPSDELKSILEKKKITLVANPDEMEMNELVQNARIHLMWTDQSTGVKLKLIHSLQSSGHVLVNNKMIEGTSLGKVCHLVDESENWSQEVQKLLNTPLSETTFNHRIDFLDTHFNSIENCSVIEHLIESN